MTAAPNHNANNPPTRRARRLLDEIQNEGSVHHALIRKIERHTGRALFVFHTNFDHPVSGIVPHDASFLEQAFRSLPQDAFARGLDLLIHSPGGTVPAADRIVRTCRAYAPAGKWRVLVTGQAMSAATLVAMAADDIVMTRTAQLGPIDPQILITRGNQQSLLPAITFIRSYESLVAEIHAAQAKGPQQPAGAWAEMLKKHDHVTIQSCYDARDAGERCAKRYLASGMMRGEDQAVIDRVVSGFMQVGEEESHAQPIGPEDARRLGLGRVEILELDDSLGNLLWELHSRAAHYILSRNLIRYIIWRDAGLNINIQVRNIAP